MSTDDATSFTKTPTVSFLDLPREIRNQIYSFFARRDVRLGSHVDVPIKGYWESVVVKLATFPEGKILSICRQIRTEALEESITLGGHVRIIPTKYQVPPTASIKHLFALFSMVRQCEISFIEDPTLELHSSYTRHKAWTSSKYGFIATNILRRLPNVDECFVDIATSRGSPITYGELTPNRFEMHLVESIEVQAQNVRLRKRLWSLYDIWRERQSIRDIYRDFEPVASKPKRPGHRYRPRQLVTYPKGPSAVPLFVWDESATA